MSRTLDIHAEHSVLASLMLWPEQFDRVADLLQPRDFGNTTHQAVYTAIASLISACQEVDTVTVHAKLQADGVELAITDLNAIAQSECTPRAVRRYAELVKGASLERQLLASVDQAGSIAEGEGELPQRLEQVVALFGGMAQQQVRKMPRSVQEIAISRIDHYVALSEGTVPKAWRTGIPSLDRHLMGGLRPGKVYVIAARPKVGKTSLAIQILLNAAKSDDLQGLVLTQEMPDDEIGDRAISNLSRVDYSSILTGKFSDNDWGALTEGVEILSKLPLSIDDQGGLTLSDIRAKARSVKGLKILVIDYLQLCQGSGRARDNRNAEIEEISRGVKALAKELGCAVLLLSQLNRDVEKRQVKEPTLADLRDSGAIEQDADAVIFLWPVKVFEDSPSHKLVGCAVEANRSGTTGKFGLDFEGRHQRWGESDMPLRAAAPVFDARGRRKHFDGDDE